MNHSNPAPLKNFSPNPLHPQIQKNLNFKGCVCEIWLLKILILQNRYLQILQSYKIKRDNVKLLVYIYLIKKKDIYICYKVAYICRMVVVFVGCKSKILKFVGCVGWQFWYNCLIVRCRLCSICRYPFSYLCHQLFFNFYYKKGGVLCLR